MTSAITATRLRKSFGGTAGPRRHRLGGNAWPVRAAALQRSDRDQRSGLRGSWKQTKQRFTG